MSEKLMPYVCATGLILPEKEVVQSALTNLSFGKKLIISPAILEPITEMMRLSPEVKKSREIYLSSKKKVLFFANICPESEQKLAFAMDNVQKVDGIKISSPWPDVDIIARHKKDRFIVIHIDQKSLGEVGCNFKKLFEKISLYEGVVDGVVFDLVYWDYFDSCFLRRFEGYIYTQEELCLASLADRLLTLANEKGLKMNFAIGGFMEPGMLIVFETIKKLFPETSFESFLNPFFEANNPNHANVFELAKEYLPKFLKTV